MFFSCAKPGIFNYGILRTLNRCHDSEGEVVEDFQLVQQASGNQLQYTMQCIELKDELAITNTLREIHILQHLGCHKYLMSMYTVFRHRQYVAMVFPAFLPIRNHLDVRYRFKNEGGKPGTGEARFNEVVFDTDTPFTRTWREENYLKTIGLFDRDAVSHVIKRVAKGLDYIHSKGYAHTEICANNVYIDLRAQIKIGGFLHCKKLNSKSRKFTGDSNCLPPECLDETIKE
uniref:Protein kinase domain-containing protein n=1 Tax=Panagrolaimus sp. ES5 TaxID=591445 RepID=A0AC34GFM8_9BILA